MPSVSLHLESHALSVLTSDQIDSLWAYIREHAYQN
jgi:hypothetical protein